MRKFIITTPYGNRYYIHDDAAIEHADGQNGGGNATSWAFRALSSTHPFKFGRPAIPFSRLAEWLATAPELLNKNGTPKWTIIDLDHGTTRCWGNTRVHGISDIREL
ncbi:MAG: hypothetical protein ACREDH_15690 [Methylocella sp.]